MLLYYPFCMFMGFILHIYIIFGTNLLTGGPAHIFRPSQSPFILGLISSIRLLTARYCHFLLVGQIQPVVTVGPFVVR